MVGSQRPFVACLRETAIARQRYISSCSPGCSLVCERTACNPWFLDANYGLDFGLSNRRLLAASGGNRSQWEKLAMTMTSDETRSDEPETAETDEPRTCELCDAAIPPARVKALPGTWLCLACSE